ncbi:conjugal transfer protein TraD [Aureimonas sp. SK2]|uniref:conjugal transfer protein TraD n=1 Tax=Aureimonas sp. SK2 TaxID=3015992 RepID=UPI002444F4F0|nr:conjugal transfer protein TraD [Aureimonas sp. SK2]
MALQREIQRAEATPKGNARRQDAHEKIALGGLVVKAGLRQADKALILGILMDGAARLSDGEYRARMVDLGRKGFME